MKSIEGKPNSEQKQQSTATSRSTPQVLPTNEALIATIATWVPPPAKPRSLAKYYRPTISKLVAEGAKVPAILSFFREQELRIGRGSLSKEVKSIILEQRDGKTG